MPKCSFKFCKNMTSRTKEDGVSYFRFPQNLIRREKWIEIVRRQRGEPSFEPNTASVVCSKHFVESDLYVTGKGITRLLDSAVLRVDPEHRGMSGVEIKKEEEDENSTQSYGENPSQPGTSKHTRSHHYSSNTTSTSGTNEHCERIQKRIKMDTAHLDINCEEEDNTQLTSFENPFLPSTRYPGDDYSSDRSDTDERCDEIRPNINIDAAHQGMIYVEIKKEIEDKSNKELICKDPSQPGTSKPRNQYSSDTSDTNENHEIGKEIKIEFEESSRNIAIEDADNGLDDLISTRDKYFDKFGENVATMLKRMPLQKALDLQPQIVNLITSTMNDCGDGPKLTDKN